MVEMCLVIHLVTALPSDRPGVAETRKVVTEAQKKEFFQLLRRLPKAGGEFFADEGIEQARPYLGVMLAVTPEDVERYWGRDGDVYALLALSAGLADDGPCRQYAVTHFATIRHPTLKLAWGVILFGKGEAPGAVVRYLHAALAAKDQSPVLAGMLGPDFEQFKKQLERAVGKDGK